MVFEMNHHMLCIYVRVRKLLVIFPMLPLPVITSKLPVTLLVILPLIRYILLLLLQGYYSVFQCLGLYEVSQRIIDIYLPFLCL